MGFFKFIAGLWAGWIALRIVRGVILARLGQSGFGQGAFGPGAGTGADNPATSRKAEPTLELVACPQCGLYTTAPCPNCSV